jgi:H+/Cl- antiporter ClcA
VGGALFALEEGTTHWNDFLTWRTFVCAMVSGFTLQITLSSEGKFGQLSQQGMITFGSFRGGCGLNQAHQCTHVDDQDHRYHLRVISIVCGPEF